MTRRLLSAVLLLTASLPSQNGLARLGAGLAQPAGSKPVQGDFNGDGKPDTAWLVKISAAPAQGVRTANPWHAGAKAGPLGVAVLITGTPGELWLLSDSEHFSTPMWSNPQGMLTVHKRGKRHVIGVATESGEDIYLYRDGDSWQMKMR